jgi:hypothetical protein
VLDALLEHVLEVTLAEQHHPAGALSAHVRTQRSA